MKKRILICLFAALLLTAIFALFSCNTNTDNSAGGSTESPEGAGVWASATYTEGATLGEGNTEFTFEVKADGKKIAFTIHTDKTILGDALMELGLIEGDVGDYGLYVKKVNGILADYDVDQHYWALWVNGSYALAGVDATEIEAGVTYTFERAK